MSAPHGRSWSHFCVGVLLNAIGFALIGPLIACAVAILVLTVAFSLGPLAQAGSNAVVEPAKLLHALLLFLPVGLFGSYMHGAVAAAVTGGVVALASVCLSGKRLYVLAGAIGAIASVWKNFASSITGPNPFVLQEGWPVAVAIAALGAFASIITTRILRGMRLSARQGSVFETVAQ